MTVFFPKNLPPSERKNLPPKTIKMAVIAQLASHALAPIFRHVPDHDARECKWCMSVKRHRSQHVHEHIPLDYQKNILTSTQITRFSMYIESGEHENTDMLEMTKKFSRVNRLLTFKGIVPTRNAIFQECKSMIRHMKMNDHLLVYLKGDIDGDFCYLTADSQRLLLCDIFGTIESPLSITIVTDSQPLPVSRPRSDCDDNIFQLPFQCEYDSLTDQAIHKPTEMTNSRFDRVKVLHLPLQDQSKEFLGLLKGNRYRLSIFRIVKNVQHAKVYSNYRFQSKLVNFTYG